jgi:hypothetical protein
MTTKPKPWIKHNGSEHAPFIGAPVELQLRSGQVVVSKRPERECWDHVGAMDDILYYREVK